MALRDINLIPYDVMHGRIVKRHVTLWAVTLLILLLLIALVFSGVTLRLHAQQRASVSLVELQKRRQLVVGESARIQGELVKLSFIRSIRSRSDCTVILSRLSHVITSDLWLTALSLTPAPTATTEDVLVMTGRCDSNASLGAFLSRIGRDPLFKDTVLKYAKEYAAETGESRVGTDKRMRIQFEIECLVPMENR